MTVRWRCDVTSLQGRVQLCTFILTFGTWRSLYGKSPLKGKGRGETRFSMYLHFESFKTWSDDVASLTSKICFDKQRRLPTCVNMSDFAFEVVAGLSLSSPAFINGCSISLVFVENMVMCFTSPWKTSPGRLCSSLKGALPVLIFCVRGGPIW